MGLKELATPGAAELGNEQKETGTPFKIQLMRWR